ncbi:unnamed protein product [Musa hybrid cultivar]
MGRARNGPRPETKTGMQTPPRLASRSGNAKPSTPVLSYGYWFLESFSHGFFSLPLLFLRSRSFAREGDGRMGASCFHRLFLWICVNLFKIRSLTEKTQRKERGNESFR